MRRSAILLTMPLAMLAPSAQAQEAREVIASAPVDQSVTLYRAPARNGGSLSLASLGGFAVISETRDVILPAGPARIRFPGVADGMIPESAVIAGLPGGVVEKNQDADLLSPSTLLRAATGRPIELRRTDPKTGKTATIPARLVSANADGVVLATPTGQEALRCSGLAESLRFSGRGEGLAAQPSLSVVTRSPVPGHVRVRLTYLAENFDWNANYIAQLDPAGRALRLTGWITLANGNGINLANAQTQIVAGRLNRTYARLIARAQTRVLARCWPMQSTSDIPARASAEYRLTRPLLYGGALAQRRLRPMADRIELMAVPAPVMAPAIAMAKAEQLGDLKLYRLPERTTIAARQMKQSRLLDQADVPFETYYRAELALMPWTGSIGPQPLRTMLRTRNDKAHHLGMPLPAGTLLIQQDQAAQMMVLGEVPLRDTAEDEKLDLAIGNAPDITVTLGQGADQPSPDRARTWTITLTNAAPHPAAIELRLPVADGWSIARTTVPAPRVDGVATAKLVLAGNSRQQWEIAIARQ